MGQSITKLEMIDGETTDFLYKKKVISATNEVPESFQVSHMICTTERGTDDGNQD